MRSPKPNYLKPRLNRRPERLKHVEVNSSRRPLPHAKPRSKRNNAAKTNLHVNAKKRKNRLHVTASRVKKSKTKTTTSR
jgi:hypothetical protein